MGKAPRIWQHCLKSTGHTTGCWWRRSLGPIRLPHKECSADLLPQARASSGVAAATLLGKFMRLPKRGLGGFAALQVPESQGKFPVVTKTFIRRAHAAGIQVHVWVVNEAPDMHRLLDLGVDGIMSDRADTLAAVMRERGHWPQNQLTA